MSTLRTITNFKERLAGGGARSNLFEVTIPALPSSLGITWGEQDIRTFNFLCKATSLPQSSVNAIEVNFRGRALKVAGDRTIEPWSVTIINDEDFRLRTAFEQWANGINKLDNATGATSPSSYMVDAYVYQLGRGADLGRFSTNNSQTFPEGQIAPLRTYKFYDIWPTNVSAIDLSYDSNDQIEEFTVDFAVQWFSIGESTGGGAADQANATIR
jgi:hypothetical protein